MTTFFPDWKVQIMWSGRGDFGGTYDNVTADCLEARWRTGFANQYDRMARPGTLRIKLDNSHRNSQSALGFYSPETSGALAGLIIPLLPIRLTATYSGDRVQFSGFILSYTVNADRDAVDILAVDALGRLNYTAFALALQTDIDEDDLIALILGEMPPTLPTMGFWWLGHSLRSSLGATTVLGSGEVGYDLDTPETTFDFAGETWRADFTTGYEAIKDVVGTTWGRFYANKEGIYQFHNRLWEFLNYPNDFLEATLLNNGASSSKMRTDVDEIANRIKVSYTPRKLGGSAVQVVSLADTPYIEPGQSISLTLQFRDPTTGEAIGASSVSAPSRLANSAENGSGTDLTANVSVTVNSTAATEMRVTLTNSASVRAYVTSLTATGTPLYTYDTAHVLAEDTASQDQYGERDRAIHLPLDADGNFAKALADYRIYRLASPQSAFGGLDFAGGLDASGSANLLDLDIMSVVQYSEPSSEATAKYYWVLEKEGYVGEGLEFHIGLTLEPLGEPPYWILDRSRLGNTNVTTSLVTEWTTRLSPF